MRLDLRDHLSCRKWLPRQHEHVLYRFSGRYSQPGLFDPAELAEYRQPLLRDQILSCHLCAPVASNPSMLALSASSDSTPMRMLVARRKFPSSERVPVRKAGVPCRPIVRAPATLMRMFSENRPLVRHAPNCA